MSPYDGTTVTMSLNTSVDTSSGELPNGLGVSPHDPRDGRSRSSSFGNLGEDNPSAYNDNISSSDGAEDNSRGEGDLGTVAGKHIEVPRCASTGQEELGDSSGRGGGDIEGDGELEPWKSPRPIRSSPRDEGVDVFGGVDVGTGGEEGSTAREKLEGEDEPERYDTGCDSDNDSDNDSIDGRSRRRRERRRRRGRFADDVPPGCASQRGEEGRGTIGSSSGESGMGDGAGRRDAADREGSVLSRTEEVVELWRPAGSQGTIRGGNIAAFSDTVGEDRVGQEEEGEIKAPPGEAARNQQGTSGEGDIEDGEIMAEGEDSCSVTASVVHDSGGNRSREQLSSEHSQDVAHGRDRFAAPNRREEKLSVRASEKSTPWSTDRSSAQHSRSSAARCRDDSWSHTPSPRSTGRSWHRSSQDRSAVLPRETLRDRYADRSHHQSGNDYDRDRPVSRGPGGFRDSPRKRSTCRSEMRSVGDRPGANRRRNESRGRDRERSMERPWRRSSPTYPAARGTRDYGRERPSNRSREALHDRGRPNEGETDLSRDRSGRRFSADHRVVNDRRSVTNGDVSCRSSDSSCRDTEGVRRHKREREREPDRMEQRASHSSHRERRGVPDRECYHGRERSGALAPSSDSEGMRCKRARASGESVDASAIGEGGKGVGAGSSLPDVGIGGDVGDGDVSGSRTEPRRETSAGEKGGSLVQMGTTARRGARKITGQRGVSFSSSSSSSLSTLSKGNDSYKCGGSNRSEDGLSTTAVEREAAEASAKTQARGDESCASSDHRPSVSAASADSSRSAFSVGSSGSIYSANPAGSHRFLGSESERGRHPQSSRRRLDYSTRDRTAGSAGLQGREVGYDRRRRSDHEGSDLRRRASRYEGDNPESSYGNERDLRRSHGSVGGNLKGSEGGWGGRRNKYGSGSTSGRDEGLPLRGDADLVDPLERPPDSAAAKLRKDARSPKGVDTRPEGIVGVGSASADVSTSKDFPHPRGLKTSEFHAKVEAKPKAGSKEDYGGGGAAADLGAATVAKDESAKNQQLPRHLLGQKPDFKAPGGGGAEGLKFASDREEDARRISQRQKQIDFGKNTAGYDEYIRRIPIHKRRKTDPVTPDKNEKMSKRQWAGKVRSWRRRLHAFDKNAPPLDTSSTGPSASDSGEPKESVKRGRSDDSGADSSSGRGRGSGELDGSAEMPGEESAAPSALMTKEKRHEGTLGDARDSKVNDDQHDEKQQRQREEMNAEIYGDLVKAGDEDDVFGSRSDFCGLFAGKGRGSDGGKWKRRAASSECSTSDGEDYDDEVGNQDRDDEDKGSDRRRPSKRPRRGGPWKGWGQAYGEGSTLRLTKAEVLEADEEVLSSDKNPPDARESKSHGTTGLRSDDPKESKNVVVGSFPVGDDAWPGGLHSPGGGQCSPTHQQQQQQRGGDDGCDIEDRQVDPFMGGGSTAWGRGGKENVPQPKEESARGESGAFVVAKGGIGDEAGGDGNAGTITSEPAALTGLQRVEEGGEDEMFSDDDLL